MAYFCKKNEINIQYFVYWREDTLKLITIIQNNNMVDTKLWKNMLHEMICKSC